MLIQKMKDFLKEEEGLAAVEYSVLSAVVISALVILAPVIYKAGDDGTAVDSGIMNVAINRLQAAAAELRKFLL